MSLLTALNVSQNWYAATASMDGSFAQTATTNTIERKVMTTMFEDVSSLNVAFGNLKGDPLNPNWDRLKSQAQNILDEYNELMDDGIGPKNMQEVRDAICDILVFTLGLAHMAGIEVEGDMKAVDESNRSKFCANEAILAATVEKYNKLGVETYVDGEFPMKRVKSAKEQTGNDGKLYQAYKMLKSVTFKEPIFAPVDKPLKDFCPKCSEKWDDHEFGVPAPYCPSVVHQ